MIDPLNLSDEQLDAAWHASRRAAERAIRDSRHATPDTWSERAQESNRRVAEFMAIDAERHAREAIRIAAPVEFDETPDYDPAPTWLMVLVGVGIVAAVAALLAKAGVW